MSADALSQALHARRGKGLDPSMVHMTGDPHPEHGGADYKSGLNSSSDAGERQGTPSVQGKTQYDRESPTHMDEHTKVTRESETPSPAASRHDKGHEDEHIQVSGEGSRGMAYPHSQSVGAGGDGLHDQIRDAVSGHASYEEYQQLKDLHPRSLGERAKMMALKDQYAGNGVKG